ncbi:MAG: type II secretion system minor pseudopilin GspK [Candidatus Hydrogenedentota bacterium]|nr:MAG: type II secretion system minor pseudopilin GspK [Candidatus Hydrogenedentota bacterium]
MRARSDERGMALLLTLLVTVILAVVILEFNYIMRVQATLSGNLVDDVRAEAAARVGVEMAKAMLLNDILADSEKEVASDTLEEEWASDIKVETDASATEAVVSDEMGKLNLNRLVNRPSAESDLESVNTSMVENVRRLFELLELDPNLVDCIVDWIDENDQEEPFGAEASYYESLSPPIRCKDGPLDSVEELLLVKEFDAGILYGEEDMPGLAEFVTVCGDQEGLVNINTAPEEVIAAVLNSESLASMIMDMRETSPFKSAEDMATRIPDVELSGKFVPWSLCFLVSSTGRIPSEGSPRREVKIKALLKRVKSEGEEPENGYFSIDTAFWKMER